MPERPNILLITTHDLGTHLGCYGWDPALSTPNLDGLASDGVRFDNHFCTAPYCSPSRGSIFTGRYPHVNGLMGLVNLGWDIPQDNPFLPTELSRAGYATALFGFQHVAQDTARLGYEHVGERGGYGCRNVAPQVVAYLHDLPSRPKRPFFMEVGFSEVHRPFGGLEQSPVRQDEIRPVPFLDDTPGLRMDLAMLYENLRRTDDSIGEVLSALETAGAAENTLVIFTTDHGIAFPRAKGTLYDVGTRTALLMRWPGHTESGTTVSALTSNVDLLPTLLDIAGTTPSQTVNGESFLDLALGGARAGRDCVFCEKNTTQGDAKRSIRTATHKYIRNYDEGPELALPTDIEVTASRRDMGDNHLAPRPQVEFYDLTQDPWERTNLAGRKPSLSTEQTMAALLKDVLTDTGDPILNGPVPRPEGEAKLVAGIREPSAMQYRYDRERQLHAEYQRLHTAQLE